MTKTLRPSRIELTLLAIVRASSGQPLADRAMRRFTDRHPAGAIFIEKMQASGLLCGGDDPDFPIAVTAFACFQQPPELLGHACRCQGARVPPCERSWAHNNGWCGKCSHHVSCHNRQPDLAEVARCLADPIETVTMVPAALPMLEAPMPAAVPRGGVMLF